MTLTPEEIRILISWYEFMDMRNSAIYVDKDLLEKLRAELRRRENE